MTKTAIVITPTTGDRKVIAAVKSVAAQTYKNTKHLLVLDGRRFTEPYIDTENSLGPGGFVGLNPNLEELILPHNTGGSGRLPGHHPFPGVTSYYGHRIYAGVSQLVNDDYVFFLDQDNTYEPDHVETLVDLLEKIPQHQFAFSLRNIYDQNGNFLCKDDCESLGLWPYWSEELQTGQKIAVDSQYLIDTSAYAFRREFLIQASQHWHFGYGGDRHFLKVMRDHKVPYGTNGRYTMNYYLDGNPHSADPRWFQYGNTKMKNMYGILRQEFPWRIAQ